LKIADIVDKKEQIQLISDRVPNPSLFCENLTGNWESETKDVLKFNFCEGSEETNPEGNALYNKKEAIWSSFQKEDGSIYLDLTFIDSDDEFSLLIKEPFNKAATQVALYEGGELVSFTTSLSWC